MPYSERVGVENPWGSWLRIDENGNYDDGQGGLFQSVRDCFWRKRLRMQEVSDHERDEMLELLLASLVALAGGRRSATEIEVDLFEGSKTARKFYGNWLAAENFVERAPNSVGAAVRLTPEGAAVMRMLMISRPHQTTACSIGPDAIKMLRALEKVVGPASSRIGAIEATVATMDVAFVRDHRRDDGIALLKRDPDGEMPLVRTIWAMSTTSPEVRDTIYEWLCDRVDRWGIWAEIAWQQGALRLDAHLLTLAIADGSTGLD